MGTADDSTVSSATDNLGTSGAGAMAATPSPRVEDEKTLILQRLQMLEQAADWDTLEREIAAIADPQWAAYAWHRLSRTHLSGQRFDRALAAIDATLRYKPGDRDLRLERAAILECIERHSDSLAELERLAAEHEGSPPVAVRLARALHFAGRGAEARAQLEAALRRWPTDAQVHAMLAQLRWQQGDREQCTQALEEAIARFPDALQLRLVAADVLRNAGFLEKALALLEGGLRAAPQSAGFLTSTGVVLDSLDRPSEALPYLRAACTRAPDSALMKRNLIPTLLRLSEAAEALRVCAELLARAPDDQGLIAYRATALRMLGDPEYARLHDYPRLVRTYRLQPPREYADIAELNVRLATEISRLHRDAQRPLDQSLRGGTQTQRNLPRDNPVIAAFFAMIDAPIKDYIARLHDNSEHPTDRRKRAEYRIAGSWSVLLKPGGFHINHVHPMGWLSSAYYVDVPLDPSSRTTRAGWLKFGEPGFPLPSCPPDHFVEPEPGMLVLFPSYMWHGTIPFEQGAQRMTVAFDVVPA